MALSTWRDAEARTSTRGATIGRRWLLVIWVELMLLVVLATGVMGVQAEVSGCSIALEKRSGSAESELMEPISPTDLSSHSALSPYLQEFQHAHHKHSRTVHPLSSEIEESFHLQPLLQKRSDTISKSSSGPRPSKEVWSAITPTFPNSIALHQDGTDFSYFIFLPIGSSKTPYKLLLDTGSSNIWLTGDNCISPSCATMVPLTPSSSSTLQITLEKSFYVQYGTGSISGSAALDILHFPTFSIATELGLVNFVSDTFLDYRLDGILGLAPAVDKDSGLGNNLTTVMEAMKTQKAVGKMMYGVALARRADGRNDGVVNFGALDSEKYDGDIGWVDSVKEIGGFWEVPLSQVMVGDRKLEFHEKKTAIVDTGTPLFFAPSSDALQLHALIPDSHVLTTHFIIPCNTSLTLTLSFPTTTTTSFITIPLPPIDYLGPPISPNSPYCLSLINSRDTSGLNTWLLGAAFLKNSYTAFDLEKGRVGFAIRRVVKGEREGRDWEREPWTTLETKYMTPVASVVATRGVSPTGVVSGRKVQGGGGEKSGVGGYGVEGGGESWRRRVTGWVVTVVVGVVAWGFIV
ncbi:acid protease [Ascodesmis nigricans]|uniref:Acid protease n=1 Tax=Ascodesmis nigricans TaxID=341454 RepID=A0A4S2MV44_9PEZI|nr:acid protease [Ascodesmis nigricans]